MQMKEIMKSFNHKILETRNTVGSDINEIVYAYLASGQNWNRIENHIEVQAALKSRKAQVSPEEYKIQAERAAAMHKEVLSWALKNGWEGEIKKVWWTARPGVLSAAVGKAASKGNPTDVLLEFENEAFLGISAKSTKGKADIGFKNPGVGAIGSALGLDLKGYIENQVLAAINSLQLPGTAKLRKIHLREPANVNVREKAEEIGRNILGMLRKQLYAHMQGMDEEDIRKHITEYWMDAGENYPYYIKVTGRGSTGKQYTASIEDPIKNEKYKVLMSEPIEVVTVGRDSIGIKAGGKNIMKMRFKYESQKLASSLKMSGDPW